MKLETKNGKNVIVGSAVAAALSLTGITLADDTAKSGEHSQKAAGAEARVSVLSNASREQILEIQRKLADRGFYQGNIDGVAGAQTRAALNNFHAQQGIEGGEYSQRTLQALGIDWDRQQVSGTETTPRAGTRESADAQRQPGRAEGTRAGVVERQPQPGREAPPDHVRLSNLNEDQAKKMQERLRELGFYRGPIDGRVGAGTRAALSRYFQRQAELAGQGVVSDSAIATFDVDADDVQPVSGEER